MDIYLHWLSCRDVQGHLSYYWIPGKQNLVDYCTKHHPESHHREKIYEGFTPTFQIELLRSAKLQTKKRGR